MALASVTSSIIISALRLLVDAVYCTHAFYRDMLLFSVTLTGVLLSVSLSVTLVDCDRIVQQKVEMGT